MEMKQNQTFSHGTYLNLTLFFIGRKILKYLNDFYHWPFSISWQKVSTSNLSEIKSHANPSVFFLIYKVVHYLNFKK